MTDEELDAAFLLDRWLEQSRETVELGQFPRCCGIEMNSERATQYLETRYECQSCRRLIAVHDNDYYTELLRQ